MFKPTVYRITFVFHMTHLVRGRVFDRSFLAAVVQIYPGMQILFDHIILINQLVWCFLKGASLGISIYGLKIHDKPFGISIDGCKLWCN